MGLASEMSSPSLRAIFFAAIISDFSLRVDEWWSCSILL